MTHKELKKGNFEKADLEKINCLLEFLLIVSGMLVMITD